MTACREPSHVRAGRWLRYSESVDHFHIACTLDPAALKARREGLLARLVGRSRERIELPDGIRLRFDPSGDILSQIAAAIDAERQCCRFLRFTLTVEPDAGAVSLDLTGPPGTREFVGGLFES